MRKIKKTLDTLKELYEYWSFLGFCLWVGNYKKASWICENKIDPIAREHPILNFITSLIS